MVNTMFQKEGTRLRCSSSDRQNCGIWRRFGFNCVEFYDNQNTSALVILRSSSVVCFRPIDRHCSNSWCTNARVLCRSPVQQNRTTAAKTPDSVGTMFLLLLDRQLKLAEVLCRRETNNVNKGKSTVELENGLKHIQVWKVEIFADTKPSSIPSSQRKL